MIILNGLTPDIFLKYDLFLFDVSGTIIDGNVDLLKIEKFIHSLSKENKKVVLFSNSSSTSSSLRAKLLNKGLYFIKNLEIFTSGDYFLELFHSNELPCFIGRRPCLSYIGLDTEPKIFGNLNCSQYSIKYSDAVIATEMFDKDLYNSFFKKCIEQLVEFRIPMICINPDMRAPVKDKNLGPGYLAIKYKEMGGKVIYIGKPSYDIFDWVYNCINKQFKFKKLNIVMIGDNINTDILGASQFGISSILVLTGITEKINFTETDIFPTYCVENLEIMYGPGL